jgi:hypothetical protein
MPFVLCTHSIRKTAPRGRAAKSKRKRTKEKEEKETLSMNIRTASSSKWVSSSDEDMPGGTTTRSLPLAVLLAKASLARGLVEHDGERGR